MGIIGGSTIVNFTRKIRNDFFRKSFASIFNLTNKKISIIVPSKDNLIDKPYIFTTYEDSIALSIAQVGLLNNGIKADVLLHSKTNNNFLSNNLLLICGPSGNTISEKMLLQIKPPFHFTKVDGRWVITNKNGEELHAQKRANNDFGLIVKVDNPWSKDKSKTKIFLCAGIGGIGTWESCSLLIEKTNVIYKRLKNDNINPLKDNFCILIEIEKGEEEQENKTSIIKTEKFNI